jgi:hypothetical protein
MVYQILHQVHLKEIVGLAQNQETVTRQNLTTLDFV